MAFLASDGDIILDTCLTDEGRKRLAAGTFQIVKWSAGDDEIDYELYNGDHASGSAYYDLNILATPVFEAFTNNSSWLHHNLISIPRNNLLYLPVLELNELIDKSARHTNGAFVVCVDDTTEDSFASLAGVMAGEDPGKTDSHVRIDQGLDTTEIPPTFALDANLFETQYQIQIDNRLGSIVAKDGTKALPSYVDDDNIAVYLLTLDTDRNFVKENTDRSNSANQAISGPRGTYLQFKVQASLELNSSTYLFTKLGTNSTLTDYNAASQNIRYIDTIVRVKGATTGYSIDCPVRFVKNR